MEITGKLVQVLEIENGTSKAGKDWSKGGFILDTGDQYNPNVCVGLFGDKLDLLQNFNVGDNVEASVNVSSREFKGKWYTQCDGWKIAKIEGVDEEQDEAVSNDLPF